MVVTGAAHWSKGTTQRQRESCVGDAWVQVTTLQFYGSKKPLRARTINFLSFAFNSSL